MLIQTDQGLINTALLVHLQFIKDDSGTGLLSMSDSAGRGFSFVGTAAVKLQELIRVHDLNAIIRQADELQKAKETLSSDIPF